MREFIIKYFRDCMERGVVVKFKNGRAVSRLNKMKKIFFIVCDINHLSCVSCFCTTDKAVSHLSYQ